MSISKEKRREYAHRHYLKHRQTIIKKCSNWHRARKFNDPIGYILTHIRNRAKEGGLEFNLERSDIVIPDYCPITGLSLYFTNYYRTPNTPSIDRINNSKGYIKGNVRMISWRANKLKADMTKEEIINLYHYVNG